MVRRTMARSGWHCIVAVGSVLTAAGLARAEQPAVVWYRSAEGCPDGPAFLALLGERAPLARLAHSGDRVDFVVTLDSESGRSAGRLERQTDSGTVAMRELDDTSCDAVAQGLALGLGLALDPDAASAEPRVAPAPEVTAPPPAAAAPSEPVKPKPAPKRVPWTGASPVPRSASGTRPSPYGLVGANLGAVSGVAPQPLGRAAAFVELDRALLPGLALRISAVGAVGSSSTSIGSVQRRIAAGRLEACPVRLGERPLALWPCAGLDLGATTAQASRSATTPWVAAGVRGRVRWWMGEALALEAEVGAEFPVTHYAIAGQGGTLYRTAPVGFSAGLGGALRLP
jgi:hypothetical protein